MRLLPMAVLLLALPLPASQETIPDQPFAESIDVSVANVEVAVTDRDGRHVRGGFWTALTLWIGARDAAGRIAPVQSVRVPVRIPAAVGEEQLGRTFAYDLRMRMAERGEQTVAVGIQDDLGHTTSFITGVFRVDRKGVTAASPGGG